MIININIIKENYKQVKRKVQTQIPEIVLEAQSEGMRWSECKK